jgi:general stress protein 26
MSGARDVRIERLLEAARKTLAEVRYCWVVTPDCEGGANARVVLAHPSDAGEDEWTRWFLTRRVARKTAEIRKAGRVTLAFQHASGEAYVALAGPAELIDETAAVDSRFRPVDDPDGTLRAQLIAVRIPADRLEMHVRGVTAEPWGHGRTLLARNGEGVWRLLEG